MYLKNGKKCILYNKLVNALVLISDVSLKKVNMPPKPLHIPHIQTVHHIRLEQGARPKLKNRKKVLK